MSEEYKKGDLVKFVGSRYYTRPAGKIYFPTKEGIARIDAIMKNSLHPYHLVPVQNGGTEVRGWVNEEDLAGHHKIKIDKLNAISFKNSNKVKIAYAINTNENIIMSTADWNDQEWRFVCRPIDETEAEKLAHMAEVAAARRTYDNIARIYKTTFIEIIGMAAGLDLPEQITRSSLVRTGRFKCFNNPVYLKEDSFLRRGDILLGAKNSAIVLSNGTNSFRTVPV